jgi:membrane fusion protein, multidrug efflux system
LASRVELDAIPGVRLAGSLRRIFPGADPASRLTTVEIELPVDANERGFLARVRMPIDPRPEVIAISTAAIGEDGGERYVLVIAEGRLHRRFIEPGVTRGQWTEVLSGLEAGEIVLATNPVDMSEGQAVRIVGWRG